MSIQTIAITKAIKLLDAAGAQYHIKHDESEWGKAIVIGKAKKHIPDHRSRGDLSAIFKPHVENLAPGQSALIPAAPYTAEEVRTSLCSWASKNWGNGTYISTIHREPDRVEILRVE